MTKHSISAITIAALMSAGIAFAAPDNNTPKDHPAHGHFMGKHEHKGHQGKHDGLPHSFFHQLNLTDAQKKQIKEITEANRPVQPADHAQKRAEFQQKMQQRKAQEQALITAKTFDEQAARRMIAERQQERAELERKHAEQVLQHLKTQHAVFQVLTPEQQKQFFDHQKQREQRREQNQKRFAPVQK